MSMPKGWEEVRLGDIGEFYRGLSYKRDNVVDDGLLVLRSNNIQNNCIEYNDLQFVNIDCKDELSLRNGDIVICMANGSKNLVGKTAEFIDNGRYAKTTVGAFCSIYRTDYKIAKYLFQSNKYKEELKILFEGTNINNLKNTDLENLSFLLPPLKEQEKIAEILSSCDEHIKNLKNLKSELEKEKLHLMNELLSDKTRFANFTTPWQEVKLADICECSTSDVLANEIEENVGEYKVYGANGLIKYIDFYRENSCYLGIVKDGAGVGRVFYCDEKSSVLSTMNVLKNKPNCDLKFLFYAIDKIDFSIYKVGSAIPHIYFKDYSKIKIKLPSLEEQKKIGEVLSACDECLEYLNELITAQTTLKSHLLTELLTGNIRVQND